MTIAVREIELRTDISGDDDIDLSRFESLQIEKESAELNVATGRQVSAKEVGIDSLTRDTNVG
jgi:hypothetical protein